MIRPVFAAAAIVALLACGSGVPKPAPLDTTNDRCAYCRMPVSDSRLAAQIVAPAEEPRFFDDLGCLAGELARSGGLPSRSVVYVADHRSGDWIPRETAVFTRSPAAETPMASHLLAHADAASRDRDPAARGGAPVRFDDMVRAAGSGASAIGLPAPGERQP
jgi:copper chaperone NosL